MSMLRIRDQRIIIIIIISILISNHIFDINNLVYSVILFTTIAYFIFGFRLYLVTNKKLFPRVSLSYFLGVLENRFSRDAVK